MPSKKQTIETVYFRPDGFEKKKRSNIIYVQVYIYIYIYICIYI